MKNTIQGKKLIIVSAPSGAGKTTLCERLIHEFPEKLVLSISCTTRAPRGKEQNGIDYHFLSREDFEKKINNCEFAEWALVHNHYYGTAKATITEAFQAEKSVVLDIDVQGAENLRWTFPGQCLSIFISPPSLDILERRLRQRGTDSTESIERRIKNAEQEMRQMNRFDKIIINDDLEQAYRELRSEVVHWMGK